MNDIVEPTGTETTETTQTQSGSLLDTGNPASDAPAAPEWHSKVPEKFMSEDGPNFESLLESYNTLESKMRNGVEVANDEQIVETMNNFGFEFEAGDVDEGFREMVEKHNMSQEMLADLMPLYIGAYEAGEQVNGVDPNLVAEYKAAQTNALKSDEVFGRDYDKNIQTVSQFTRGLPEEVLSQPLLETAAGIKFLYSLATSNKPVMDHSGAKSSPASTGEAKERLTQVNKELMYMDNTDPRYDSLKAESWELAREIASTMDVESGSI